MTDDEVIKRATWRLPYVLIVAGIVIIEAAAIVVIALAVYLVTGCAGPAPRTLAPGRSSSEQTEATVHVVTETGHGTGVVIAFGKVLTAAHAVRAGGLFVIGVDGVRRAGHVLWRDVLHDLALVAAPGLRVTRDAVYDEPRVGGAVCSDHAVPERYRTCGTISEVKPVKYTNGLIDINMSVPTVPGNSGSALYDEHGHLVGIVTNYTTCEPQPCVMPIGGRATSVLGRVP